MIGHQSDGGVGGPGTTLSYLPDLLHIPNSQGPPVLHSPSCLNSCTSSCPPHSPAPASSSGLPLPGIETFSYSQTVPQAVVVSEGDESYLSPLLTWSPHPTPPPAILQTLQPIKPEFLRASEGVAAIKTEPHHGQLPPRLTPAPLNRLLEYPLPPLPANPGSTKQSTYWVSPPKVGSYKVFSSFK